MSGVNDFKRSISNPMGRPVAETKRVPVPGDKVIVTDDMFFSHADLRKLVGLKDIVTVKEVYPMVIGGEAEGYHWEYEIVTEEFPDVPVLGWHYKFQ